MQGPDLSPSWQRLPGSRRKHGLATQWLTRSVDISPASRLGEVQTYSVRIPVLRPRDATRFLESRSRGRAGSLQHRWCPPDKTGRAQCDHSPGPASRKSLERAACVKQETGDASLFLLGPCIIISGLTLDGTASNELKLSMSSSVPSAVTAVVCS